MESKHPYTGKGWLLVIRVLHVQQKKEKNMKKKTKVAMSLFLAALALLAVFTSCKPDSPPI